jgi:hypothetical protein
LEIQWRAAMVRASIQLGPRYTQRSRRYARLDPSEKGAVSFFLGQAQAKLFAHDFFRVSRFVHYDAYLAHHGRPRRRTRPDFIGFFGRSVAIAVEAKGRSLGFDRTLVANAKKQASSLPVIKGHPTPATYVHVAYFHGDQWRAHLEDPPRRRNVQTVDPAHLTLLYYLPIVNAIRARGPELRGLEEADGSYLQAHFAEVDIRLSVRADIAELVPTDDIAALEVSRDAEAAGASSLYSLALELDSDGQDRLASTLGQGDGHRFLGGDGVAIELGPSWTDWA